MSDSDWAVNLIELDELQKKNIKLELENEKMRECLKYYANENLWLYEKGQACKFNEKNHIQGFDKARMALQELEAGE